LQILQEQIASLKTMMVDHEDLQHALADKADRNLLNKKVSYDQFQNACDDLSKGLEKEITKLTQQVLEQVSTTHNFNILMAERWIRKLSPIWTDRQGKRKQLHSSSAWSTACCFNSEQ